jgi:hypothetical protein
VPIPFHDSESIEALGTAAYLRLHCLTDEPQHWAGCIFLINGRGEPLEFVYNRLQLMPTVLWREQDAAAAAARRVMTSLFAATVLTPKLLFVLESPMIDSLLGANRSIWPDIPDVRVKLRDRDLQDGDFAPETRPTTVIWGARPPDPSAAKLYSAIDGRSLLLEPFERALIGLREVYPEWAGLII